MTCVSFFHSTLGAWFRAYCILTVLFSIGFLLSCDGSSSKTIDRSVYPSLGKPSAEQVSQRDLDERPNVIVVFSDDQGFADLGANGVVANIKTPHLDLLAADGARMTSGYATAPQCTPSRAGLVTGQYQQRFGLDDNRYSPMPLSTRSFASHLKDAGYSTGMVGKWHLEIDKNSSAFDVKQLTLKQRMPYFPDNRGFDDVYFGYLDRWWANYDLSGEDVPVAYRRNDRYRLDVASDAGLAFIERHKQTPFFLYLSYYAPHVPLEAPETYLSRHEGVVEVRRRHALAMMSAIDDGVGRIRQSLEENSLRDNTLIFFISDNGAPLGIVRNDLPVEDESGEWDGSLNDPWIGEKGMLAEGGIRVPYIVAWPDVLPAGVVYDEAVSTLDVAATSLAAANVAIPTEFDGENLLPYLRDQAQGLDERALYWRFWSQAAIRKGKWKYLIAGDREFLFDLTVGHESANLIGQQPALAATLKQQLQQWTTQLQRPGMPDTALNNKETEWYDYYLDL